MKLTPDMTQAELRAALLQAAQDPLGPEGAHHMASVAAQAARAIHAVLQAPLLPFGEEPEVAGQARRAP